MTAKPAPAPSHRLKFESIEAGRAVAAICVVFYHAGNNIAEPRFFDTTIFGGHLANFNVGIDFFFVLSGFIISWVHWNDVGQKGRLANYARRRFLRIYPPYWGILIPLTILYLLSPGAGKATQHDPANIFFSLTLLPYTAQPILGAAWTLVYEVMFYVVFGSIILAGKRARWALPLWAAIIGIAQLFPTPAFPGGFFLSVFNLEFLLGIAAALVLRNYTVPVPRAACGIGIATFLGLMTFAIGIQDNPLVTRLCFGLSAALIILGLVECERTGRLRVPRFLRFLGAASYSIYLIHGFVLSMTIQALIRLGGRNLPLSAILFTMVACGIVAGCLYHVFAERPLILALRQRIEPRAVPKLRPKPGSA